jgi:ABC-type transport system involved in multi-copper enzyme maturation permease subunit
MKALIQKDLRENLKAPLIGLVIFSLLLFQAYMVSSATVKNMLNSIQPDLNYIQPLLSENLLAEAAYFCAIFGAALGWLQARNEAHRDLWAFLIHRPVTRTEIFQGKAIAGLCLYVFGAGLPLAVFIAVVRWPGHIAAPFEWAMVLPLVSVFLTGAAWYFAGLLTGLRQARWYASRGFGLALAMVSSLCVFNLNEFWKTLLVTAIVVVILAAAVWGAYQSGGYYSGQPAAGRLGLIVAMTAGCGAVLFAGAALVFSVLSAAFYEPVSVANSIYQMTRDGGLYKMTFLNNGLAEITDLEGHPLPDSKTGLKMERAEFEKRLASGPIVWSRIHFRGVWSYIQYVQDRNNSRAAARFFDLWTISDKVFWYLDRHGKILGYDGWTRKFAGSLEPQGNEGGSGTGPFLPVFDAGNYYMSEDIKLIATAKVVYQADFKARALKAVFSLTNDDEICGFCGFVRPSQNGDEPGRTRSLCLATEKTVRLLDSEGRTIFSAPYQPGSMEYPEVRFLFLQPTNGSAANYAVWFYPDDEMNQKSGWKMPIHVIWIGPGQTVARSADLPVLHPPENLLSWPDKLVATLLPPPAHLAYDDNIRSPWHPPNFALAIVSAWIGWALTRRYNYSIAARAGWTLFILLLGIAGLLALLCAQEWPAREACPQCKKLRAVDRETCEHCQAPFAPPEKNGTEIFAPLAKKEA